MPLCIVLADPTRTRVRRAPCGGWNSQLSNRAATHSAVAGIRRRSVPRIGTALALASIEFSPCLPPHWFGVATGHPGLTVPRSALRNRLFREGGALASSVQFLDTPLLPVPAASCTVAQMRRLPQGHRRSASACFLVDSRYVMIFTHSFCMPFCIVCMNPAQMCVAARFVEAEVGVVSVSDAPWLVNSN